MAEFTMGVVDNKSLAVPSDGTLGVTVNQPACFDTIFFSGGVEILRLTPKGMVYKGQLIEDAGEAHTAFMDVMGIMKQGRLTGA